MWTPGLPTASWAATWPIPSQAAVCMAKTYPKRMCVNIYAWLKAQETEKPVQLVCAIGDDTVDGTPYAEIVETARRYIQSLGGFENFAEWGLVR